jgi:hypothetical protein
LRKTDFSTPTPGYDSYKTHLSVKTKMESQFQRSEWDVVMLTTERHFRVMQVFCILVVLTCFRVALRVDKTSPEITPIQWLLIGMGVWAILLDSFLSAKFSVIPIGRVAVQLDRLRSVAGEQETSFAL